MQNMRFFCCPVYIKHIWQFLAWNNKFPHHSKIISLDYCISLHCSGAWFVNIKNLYFVVLNIKLYA